MRCTSVRWTVVIVLALAGLGIAQAPVGPWTSPAEAEAVETEPLPTPEEIRVKLEERATTLSDMRFLFRLERFYNRGRSFVLQAAGQYLNSGWIRLDIDEVTDYPLSGAVFVINLKGELVETYISAWSEKRCTPMQDIDSLIPGLRIRFDRLHDREENGWLGVVGIDEAMLANMEVVRREMLNGTEHLVVRMHQVNRMADDFDLDDWFEHEATQTALGATEFLEAWIDTGQWVITRVDLYDKDGTQVSKIELISVRVNTGLTLNQLQAIPGGPFIPDLSCR